MDVDDDDGIFDFTRHRHVQLLYIQLCNHLPTAPGQSWLKATDTAPVAARWRSSDMAPSSGRGGETSRCALRSEDGRDGGCEIRNVGDSLDLVGWLCDGPVVDVAADGRFAGLCGTCCRADAWCGTKYGSVCAWVLEVKIDHLVRTTT